MSGLAIAAGLFSPSIAHIQIIIVVVVVALRTLKAGGAQFGIGLTVEFVRL